MSVRFNNEEFNKLKKLLPIYEWALQLLTTKLNIIHQDLINTSDSSAIEYIRSRIKSPESIAQKLSNLNLELTAESARANLTDIAGARIICPFTNDIHKVVELLRALPDVKIIREKDYVNNPKPSGYRSYHVIVEVPVFFGSGQENVPLELQIRTEAMNFWASLEHKTKYKFKGAVPAYIAERLESISYRLIGLDDEMLQIYNLVNRANGEKRL